MNRAWVRIMVIAIVGIPLLACAQTEPEAPPASAKTGPDPVAVDPDHYKAEFENDFVRVLRINYGPGEASVMHDHPDGVAVFLTDHHVRFELPDGTTEEHHMDAGSHLYVPAGQHLPKNIGEAAWELVLVELKSSPTSATETGPDPTEVDSAHYTTEFENERVRVLRIAYEPGEASVMHYHPASVAVFLTPHHVEFGKLDGSSEEAHVGAGQHLFSPAEQHLPKNLGDARLELVLVELKS